MIKNEADLLILLKQLSETKNHVFRKVHIGRGKGANKLNAAEYFKYPSLIEFVCFLYAFSSCDITSLFIEREDEFWKSCR